MPREECRSLRLDIDDLVPGRLLFPRAVPCRTRLASADWQRSDPRLGIPDRVDPCLKRVGIEASKALQGRFPDSAGPEPSRQLSETLLGALPRSTSCPLPLGIALAVSQTDHVVSSLPGQAGQRTT